MKKLVLLLVFAMLVLSVTGCLSQTAKRSNERNWDYLRDDSARALGLDQPSSLHPRDNEPADLYEPYRRNP